MKRLIIFDLDGTLLDTLEDLRDATNYALRSENFPERSLDEVRNFVGNGIRLLIERAVPQGTPPAVTDRVFGVFKSYYADHCMIKTVPYAGIADVLRLLKAQGCLLGVVSNKADAPAKAIVAHYFPAVFDSVVGEREGVRKKPAPDAVFETVKALGCTIDELVYVGDSDVDAQTAQNAGCRCVLVSWGFRERALLESFSPSAVVDTAKELLKELIK